jgi:membrane protease YdiL (CAAX protease family)
MIKPMGPLPSLLFTAVPAILLYLTANVFIPLLFKLTGLPVIVCWYISALFFIFLPMFIISIVLFRKENNPEMTLKQRFRLNNFNLSILKWSIAGTTAVFILTYLFMEAARLFITDYSPQPLFMKMTPLKADEMWILAAWIPMFIFNILGEAFYWRGYMFPRQELAYGKITWFVHGCCWLLFHFAFGMNLIITLIPIIFITSWIVQKTRSTWSDIIIHAAVNGTGFIMVATGVV